jgi:hypothetical protein
MTVISRRFRLGIVRWFARLMRVPFDPLHALWRWNDPSTFPRCSDPEVDASTIGLGAPVRD